MTPSRTCALIGVLSTAAALPCYAEAESDIPNIVVIGVRESLPGTDVLEMDEQSGRPAADGGELLRSITGLSLGRFGGRGLEPTLRGQSQGRINVLLDGSYVNGGCPNRMDPPTSFAAVNSYERIVVLKGVQTLRYGGGGSGGTLLFERENEPSVQGFSGGLRAGASNNGLDSDLAADLAWSSDRVYLRLNMEDRSAQNYEDGDGNAVRSAFTEQSAYLAGGLKFRTQDRLEVALERTETNDALFPGAGMDAPMDQSDQLRMRYDGYDLGPFVKLSAELYRADVEHLMDNYSNRDLAGPVALRVPSNSDTRGARFIGELSPTADVALTLGLDYQGRERTATRFMGPPEDVSVVNAYLWPATSLDQYGVFAEGSWTVTEQTLIKGGLRYDHVRADAEDVNQSPPSPALASANMLYRQYYGVTHETAAQENNVGGLARIEHRFDNRVVGFAGISRTLRTADASERFLAAASPNPMMRWVGNPALNPEAHHQADAGLVFQSEKHRIDTVVFYDDVADYILRDRAHGQADVLRSDNASIYRNVDARLYGIEGNWQWDAGYGLELNANMAWVRATNTSEDRPLAQTPPLNGSVGVSWQQGPWRAGSSLRWSAEQTRVESNPMQDSGLDAGETPGWGVVDLFGRMDLGTYGAVHAGVDNLFDRSYANHLNRGNRDPFYPEALRVNEPGRVVWARYEYLF